MSRLQESLDKIEAKIEITGILNNLLRDCQPFLRDLLSGKNFDFMYSGRHGKPLMFKGRVRKNRKPTDTHKEIHRDLDILFSKKFGYPCRSNSVFCTGLESVASEYGASYMIFPIGKYKCVWSQEIEDLYMEISKKTMSGVDSKHQNGLMKTVEFEISKNGQFSGRGTDANFDDYYNSVDSGMEYDDFYFENYDKWLNQRNKDILSAAEIRYWAVLKGMVDTYESGDIYGAIYNEGEIMISCNEYWAISNEGSQMYIYSMLWDYFKKFGAKGHKKDTTYDLWFDMLYKKLRL